MIKQIYMLSTDGWWDGVLRLHEDAVDMVDSLDNLHMIAEGFFETLGERFVSGWIDGDIFIARYFDIYGDIEIKKFEIVTLKGFVSS